MKKKLLNAITFSIGYFGFYAVLFAALCVVSLAIYYLIKSFWQWL